MSDEDVKKEVRHLERLKKDLDADMRVPLRFDIQRGGIGDRRLEITIRGIRSLVDDPSRTSDCVRATFTITVEIPPGYPWTEMPDIRFKSPIPFHPHIYTDGRICWGSTNKANPDFVLADWFRGVVEYLQYSQDPGSMLILNPNSPANSHAMQWWKGNRGTVTKYVPPIDMARFRALVDRSRG